MNSEIGQTPGASPLLTLDELASRENLDAKYLRLLVRAGLIPGMKFGRDFRFNGDAVRAALHKIAGEWYQAKETDLAAAAGSES